MRIWKLNFELDMFDNFVPEKEFTVEEIHSFDGINVINVLDAIDYEKADYKTFRDGKRIMAFRKYAFLSSVVLNMPIFKIVDEKTRYAFVSSEFKKLVEDNGLIGFKFELVWDSEKS